MSTTLNVNGKPVSVDVPDDTRLLWPALCNATFAATGRRIRRLPIADQLGA